MPRHLVNYTHVEETTYEEWVEAATEEEAIRKVEEDPSFEREINVQGLEMKDFKVVDTK